MRALALLLALAPLTGCGDEPPAQAPRAPAPPAAGQLAAPPPIVLITLDTLRREHLSCYGYFRATTPRLDAFAAESLVFERALASMASTLPSHLTLLTGLYPHQHGMTSNRRGASVPFTSEVGRLSAAAVLAQCGYRTAAFVSASPLSLTTGIQTGFQHYSYRERSAAARQRAGDTNALVFEWLERHAAEPGPLFLWVHYFDTHEPNEPPPPYDTRYQTDERQRQWIRERGIDPAALEQRYSRSSSARRHFLRNPPEAARDEGKSGKLRVTLDSVAELMNRYDGSLSYLDENLGALFDALRRHGLYHEALIVVVGDHGQSLGENTWLGHGTITNVNTFVPLLLRLPDSLAMAPQRSATLVSLTDVMPTLLARFELPNSELLSGQFEGEDVLSGAFARDFALTERTADAPKDGESGRQFALLSGAWKYIHRPEGQDELYDLAAGGEFVDVLAQHPEVGARLRAETLTLLARRPALLEEARGEVDARLIEQLEDLGYGGGDDEGPDEPSDD